MQLNLSLYQTRVLAVLIEKEITTPDQYPLSLNALVNGCNQKSSREPVLQLDESSVQETIDELKALRMIREESGYGSRVVKLKHRFCNTEFSDMKFSAQELGIICVLFLRGPQTPGELRTRTNRLCQFSDANEVETVLENLANHSDGAYVVQLHREPGKRDARWAHLFSGEVDLGTKVEAPTRAASSGQEQRITDLEQEVKWLKEQLQQIKSELGL